MSTTAEAPTEQPKAARVETEYHVLRQTDAENGWEVIGEFTATGGKGVALKKYVDAIPAEERAGAYKAVAKSAWAGGVKGKPRAKVETDFEEIE